MGDRLLPRRSQGTDMFEFLRFPDAIAFDHEVSLCNSLAVPLGNRSVTNKCYVLLWKATYFPSSVFIGVNSVLDKLQTTLYVPCLVILAGDTYIDQMMGRIPTLCIQKDIPYIFIPNKLSIGEALNVDEEILAVLISFNRDPGMRKEFEDAYEGIRAQCGRKRKRRRSLTSPNPHEMGQGETPQMVSTYVSTVPAGVAISPLLYDAGPSSSSEWLTITEDDTESTATTMDFSVSVPENESSREGFQEYIRVPSPTPALPPSQLMHFQQQARLNLNAGDMSSIPTSTTEDSPRPGTSREYTAAALNSPRKRLPVRQEQLIRKRRAWPIPLPFAPPNQGAGEGPSVPTPPPAPAPSSAPDGQSPDLTAVMCNGTSSPSGDSQVSD